MLLINFINFNIDVQSQVNIPTDLFAIKTMKPVCQIKIE